MAALGRARRSTDVVAAGCSKGRGAPHRSAHTRSQGCTASARPPKLSLPRPSNWHRLPWGPACRRCIMAQSSSPGASTASASGSATNGWVARPCTGRCAHQRHVVLHTRAASPSACAANSPASPPQHEVPPASASLPQQGATCACLQVKPLRNTWEQGIREGTLRVPEGVPFMWNVFDHPLCHSSEVGLLSQQACCGVSGPTCMLGKCSRLWCSPAGRVCRRRSCLLASAPPGPFAGHARRVGACLADCRILSTTSALFVYRACPRPAPPCAPPPNPPPTHPHPHLHF